MENIMVNGTTSIEGLKDKNLQAAARRIVKASDATRKSLFAIAYELNRIDGRQLYKKDGFKNITDCAAALFGYKKAMTNNLVRVARNYISASSPVCLLPAGVNENGESVAAEWTVGQLQEVLSLEPETVRELVENGTLNAKMTAKAIRAAVKAYKNGESGETEDEPEEIVGNVPPADVIDTDGEEITETENAVERAQKAAITALQELIKALPQGTVHAEELADSIAYIKAIPTEW